MRVQSWCDRTQLPSFAWHGRARAPVPILALAIPTILALSAGLGALPSSALYTVHKVQQSIPMADGVRLSATLYMPDNAKPGEKFPALLEYLPYRKDDATAARDYPIHTWFAARGYVSVRVDIRGFGASEGTPTDREYSEQEQLDGEQVIAW
ncbi:MAG TPA: CocE/NonD family hydrolase, partial [Terriglobales bacterium]|nr:CocE/NonD family hydrolase [Terriglobales bacterium]